MGTTPHNVIAEYQKWNGYKESPANSNDTKAGAWYGMNGEPWCAMQNSYMFSLAGHNLDIQTAKGYSYCPSGEAWFKEHGLWRAPDSWPQKAWLTFYNFSGGSIAEHTGCVSDDVNVTTGDVPVWEGNTIPDGTSGNEANGGEVCHKLRNRSLILGYGDTSGLLVHPKASDATKDSKSDWHKDNGSAGHPVLHHGEKSEPVKHLQYKLIKAGLNVVVDGVFGAQTLDSVRQYQHHLQLTIDGVVGLKTWTHLHRH